MVSVLAIFCTVLLFCFVRHQTKLSSRHEFVASPSGCSSIVGSSIAAGDSSSSVRRKNQKDERSRLIRTQSILYVAANLNNFVWLILFNRLVLNSLDAEQIHSRDPIVFASGILLFLFMPMYGFFNFCIYCYPRFRRIKRHFPEKTFWWCLQLLYTKDQGEREISQQRILQRHRQSRGNLLDTSSGALSFAITLQPTENPKRHDTSKTNEEIRESAETQSFHNSGDTDIVLPFEDKFDGDDAILMTNSTNDFDQRNNSHDTSTTLLDEEAMIDVAMDNDDNNKLYFDY
jgi:hypothetical protein